MKQIIAILTVLGLLMTSTSFASHTGELEDKLMSMTVELDNDVDSLGVQKLILSNILSFYASSSIDNPELKKKIEFHAARLEPTFTSRERSRFNAGLAKIN